MSPKVHSLQAANFMRDERGQAALANAGCTLVSSVEGADWVILDAVDKIEKFSGRVPNILVYTHEPRYAIDAPFFQQVNDTAVYTYSLSLGHFRDIWNIYVKFGIQPFVDPAVNSRSGVVFMASNQPKLAYSHPADLIGLRAEIAEYGVKNGLLSLYGKNWGPLPTIDESRGGSDGKSWFVIKHEQISTYKFNIALENTYIPNYISEKIWQSIQAGCLPIYFGSSWMDRLVPADLYVDLRNYAAPEQLFAALERMPDAERADRVRALQGLLTELRRKARGDVWEQWRQSAAHIIIDTHAQQCFSNSSWAPRSQRS